MPIDVGPWAHSSQHRIQKDVKLGGIADSLAGCEFSRQGASPACRVTFVFAWIWTSSHSCRTDPRALLHGFSRVHAKAARFPDRYIGITGGCVGFSLLACVLILSRRAGVVTYATNVGYRECVEVRRATKRSHGLGHVASRTGGVPYRMQGK